MGPATSWPTTTSSTSTTASTSRPTATRTGRWPPAPAFRRGRTTRRASSCDRRPVAIDFYNNYITNSHDNPIETDGGMHNIRVMRNMFINHASHAFCNQPALGGPVYWIRNIAYNLPGGSTRLTNGSAGARVLQQHHPVGDAGGARLERSLAQQSDARAERGARHLQRRRRSPTTRRRTTTASGPIPAWTPRSCGTRRRRARWPTMTGPGHAAALQKREFARWPNTARRRGRTSTACWWTTTSS